MRGPRALSLFVSLGLMLLSLLIVGFAAAILMVLGMLG
jgi:hypothetical protein